MLGPWQFYATGEPPARPHLGKHFFNTDGGSAFSVPCHQRTQKEITYDYPDQRRTIDDYSRHAISKCAGGNRMALPSVWI